MLFYKYLFTKSILQYFHNKSEEKTLNCPTFGKPYFTVVILLTSLGQVRTTHLEQLCMAVLAVISEVMQMINEVVD